MKGWMWRWLERMKTLLARETVERELDDEIRFHLDMEIRDRIDAGMAPAEARRTAYRDFGGVERFREEVRSARWTARADRVVADVRFAFRALRARPTFSATVLLTLALGVGVTTAIFSVVDGVLLERLPYDAPDRIVRIQQGWVGQPQGGLSPAEYIDWVVELDDFDGTGAYTLGNSTVTGDGPPERVRTAFVSAGVFDALGAVPVLGRTFTEAEDHEAGPLVVITHGMWTSRFGGDPDVVGQTMEISGRPREIVGVLGPDFRMPEDFASEERVRLISPLGIDPLVVDRGERGSHFLAGITRLPPSISFDEGSRRIEATAAAMVREFPNEYPVEMEFRATAVPLTDAVIGTTRPLVFLLFGAVVLVFLIVCVNVTNLLVVRTEGRRGELAVRKALGAGRSRILSQVGTESVVIGALGGIGGLLVAYAATDLLRSALPADLPRLDAVTVDLRVVAFGLTLALIGGIVTGIVPALRAGSAAPAGSLRSGARAVSGNRSRALHRWLVGSQVALSLLLAAGAGLVVRSFVAVSQVDPGYSTQGIVSARVSLPTIRYPDDASALDFYRTAIDALRTIPGTIDAAAVTNLPLATGLGDMSFELEENRIPEGRDRPDADWQVVTPGYFATMDVQAVHGRVLEDSDRADAIGAVVINETMAERHWPAADPIGRRIRLGGQMTEPRWATVIGVVEDVRHGSLDEVTARPQMYFAHNQFRAWSNGAVLRGLTFVIRSERPVAEVQRSVRDVFANIDDQLAVFQLRSMEEVTHRSLGNSRMLVSILGLFSLMALTLAAIGVYGVTAYTVGSRQGEFGIRQALGASPREVLRTVLEEGFRIAVPGALVGLVLAITFGGTLRGFLYEVEPYDPVTLGLTFAAVLCAALAAMMVPARRATRIDPATSLRLE